MNPAHLRSPTTDMVDVETANLLRNRGAGQQFPSTALPPNHPFNLGKRVLILLTAIWGLHEFTVYHAVLRSPHVSHAWFKLGFASSVAILLIKSYVELYEGKTKKRKVDYDNFRQTTHIILLLLLLASLSFHIALWPHYGGFKTILIMIMFGWGVLLQVALLLPTWAQNMLGFVLMTFFIQEYA